MVVPVKVYEENYINEFFDRAAPELGRGVHQNSGFDQFRLKLFWG